MPVDVVEKLEFEYHLNLHYSQTEHINDKIRPSFEYHLNLHYSQTTDVKIATVRMFEYHLNLHYSQTRLHR